MGVHLYFTSVEKVLPEAAEAIREDSRAGSADQPWVLCEPPHFYPEDEDGRMRGGSKLNLHPWADEWEQAAQHQPERNDLQELLHRLCAWSADYQVDWELSVDGSPLGRIEGGVCPPEVQGAIEAFADLGEYLAEEFPMEDGNPDANDPPGGFRPRLWPEPE